jgi:hypothetical protein
MTLAAETVMTNDRIGAATCVVLVMVSLGALLAAQGKPDFSGTWILESGPPGEDVPQTLSVTQSLVRTNVRGEPMERFFKDISITRALASGTRSNMYLIGVEGGTVSGNVNDPRTHYRVVWEDQTLVIESGSYTGPTPETENWAELREVWSLDSGARLRLAMTTRSSVAAPRTVIMLYRRQ